MAKNFNPKMIAEAMESRDPHTKGVEVSRKRGAIVVYANENHGKYSDTLFLSEGQARALHEKLGRILNS